MTRITSVLVLAVLATAACNGESPTAATATDGPSFAHESNNYAELTSASDPALGGTAIVNFVAGKPGWQSTVNVSGDLDDGAYTAVLTRPGFPDQVLCSFSVAGEGGRQGCSTGMNVGGFAAVEVRDSEGGIVLSGTFARRGGTRFKP